jgi:cyclic pyranopterin phosphate synthase
MTDLIDAHQRKFVYLRLSVTDRCNFRCVYCLPRGYEPTPNQEVELRQDEIVRLMRAFSLLGVSKIRLTGGEPTVRRDLVEIAQQIHQIPGIEKVAITTNGHRLLEIGRSLKAAGIHSLNVSLDSLDPDTFNRLTGTDRFAQVFRGIDHALELGFPEVKINTRRLKTLSVNSQSSSKSKFKILDTFRNSDELFEKNIKLIT